MLPSLVMGKLIGQMSGEPLLSLYSKDTHDTLLIVYPLHIYGLFYFITVSFIHPPPQLLHKTYMFIISAFKHYFYIAETGLEKSRTKDKQFSILKLMLMKNYCCG